MAARLVFVPPVTVHRVGGKWAQVALERGTVPLTALTSADPAPPGEPGGQAGRLVFLKGHRYEVSPALAKELAGVWVRYTTATFLGGREVTRGLAADLKDWVTREEVPEAVTTRTHRAPAPFGAGQQAVIDRLEARVAELEAERHPEGVA